MAESKCKRCGEDYELDGFGNCCPRCYVEMVVPIFRSRRVGEGKKPSLKRLSANSHAQTAPTGG